MLPKQLTAAATWHEDQTASINAGKCDQPTTSAGVQRRYQPTFRAQAQPVRGVLDVAAGHHSPVVNQCGRTYWEGGVGRVRVLAGVSRGGTQPVPVDRSGRFRGFLARHPHFSKGMPSAAGGLTRPTKPATAMIVATYGKINRNWLGIGVLNVCS